MISIPATYVRSMASGGCYSYLRYDARTYPKFIFGGRRPTLDEVESRITGEQVEPERLRRMEVEWN